MKAKLEPVFWAAAKTTVTKAIKAKLESTQLELQKSALALVARMPVRLPDLPLDIWI